MGNRIRKGVRLRAGVAASVVAALLAGSVGAGSAASALPGPELEYEWEVGTVKVVHDGDTLDASITKSNSGFTGTRRVRTVGVQAPETSHPEDGIAEQCGAAEAKRFLQSVAPEGATVQLRALQGTSRDTTNGRDRLVRSIYVQDEEGNWFDTSRELVSSGRAMWFPKSSGGEEPEWAHNLEYRVLADDAAGQSRGLWTPNLCGGAPYAGAQLRVWVKYWGTEEVYVENLNSYPVDLTDWLVRDAAVSGYQPGRRIPSGSGTTAVIPPGEARKVVSIASTEAKFNNLPADNAAFEGDAVYLMDKAGPYGTGNLRAWFPYPCNPDNCGDALSGAITMSTPVASSGPMHAPSRPGSVAVTASTDGSGSATVTWAAPTDAGGTNLRYTVSATSPDGGTVPATAPDVTETTRTFTGLTLGRSYTFTVQAVSDGGTSDAVSSATPVAPAGPPGAPTAPVAEARDGSAAVSWVAGGTGGIDANSVTYTATSSPGGRTCTASGATSCLVSGLSNGTSYTFTVQASTTVGTSAPAGPTAPVTPAVLPAPTAVPAAPVPVVAMPGNTRAVVSWAQPGVTGAAPITSSLVTASNGRTCTAANGTTSCVVTGLSNGSGYTFTVTASNAVGPGSASAASNQVIPFASGTARTSAATSPPPNIGSPWQPGYVDLQNTSGGPVRLGGYGLWDAKSSRYDGTENRAAYLFDANLGLGAGKTLRVYLGGVAGASSVPGIDQTLFAGTVSVGDAGSFVELANLNGAQVACRSFDGGSCARAKVLSAPSSPVGITARTTPSSVTVTWGAPISTGGSAITGYTATAHDAPIGGNPIASCTAGGGDRSCSFPGSVGGKYYVEVVAANAQGTSGPSWRVLAAPRTVPGAPPSVSVTGTPGGLNVTWTPAVENGAAITKYTAAAYAAATGGSAVGTCSTSNGTMGGCTIFGLTGGRYYVEVKATNRAGTGPASSPRTGASADAGRAVSTYSKGKVTVRWDSPANAAALGITGYSAKLYTKSSGGKLVGSCSAPAGATSCKTKKMKKRSKYYIALTVSTSGGSYTVKPRIATGPARKASAPKVTSATPSGKRVVISWARPSSTGYTYLKSYGARLYSKSKGGSVRASCSAVATVQTCTTKAMKKGTYYAAARVKNSKGWSSWSKRVKVRVP